MEKFEFQKEFERFLDDEGVYRQNEIFWYHTLLSHVLEVDEWCIDNFANGKKMYDGNPLFSCKVKNKAIRICQSENEHRGLKFLAYTTLYPEYNNIYEICIHIKPIKEIYSDVVDLLESFLSENMDEFNEIIVKLNSNWRNK